MRCLRWVRRLFGARRLGVPSGTLVVGVLALLGGSVNGSADIVSSASELSPPYAFGYRTETSSLMAPCQEVPNAPEDAAGSEPGAGEVAIGIAADAEQCTSLAHDVSEVWDLGPAPDALAGQPVHVTVIFASGTFRSEGRGEATVGGSLNLSVAGSEEWTLRSFECSAGACRSGDAEAQDEGQIVLDGTMGALPARIEAQFRAEAFVKDGTGRARVGLTGRLVSVSFAAGV